MCLLCSLCLVYPPVTTSPCCHYANNTYIGIVLEILGFLLVPVVPFFVAIEGLYLIIAISILKKDIDEGPAIVFSLFATITESIPELIVQTIVFATSLQPSPLIFAVSSLLSLISICKSIYHFVKNRDILHGLSMAKEHSNSVTAITFSPNNMQVVSGSKDKTIRFWDIRDNRDNQGDTNTTTNTQNNITTDDIQPEDKDSDEVDLVPICKVEAGIYVYGLKFIDDFVLLGSGEKMVKKWDLRDIFGGSTANENGVVVINNEHFIRAFDHIELKNGKHLVAINGFNDVRKGSQLFVHDVTHAIVSNNTTISSGNGSSDGAQHVSSQSNINYDCPLLFTVDFDNYGLLMNVKFFEYSMKSNNDNNDNNDVKLAIAISNSGAR